MKYTSALLAAALIGGMGTAGAELHAPANGQVYDDVLNISWLQDANFVKTSCDANNALWQAFDPTTIAGNSGRSKAQICDDDGRLNWNEAESWIAVLNANNHLGHNDWRQWQVPNPTNDPTCSSQDFDAAGSDRGHRCTGSEMGNLFNVTLNNPNDRDDKCSPNCLVNTGPFSNFRSFFYWSGTVYAPSPSDAWGFRPVNGNQVNDDDIIVNDDGYVWPVRPGQDVGAPTNGDLENPTANTPVSGIGVVRGWLCDANRVEIVFNGGDPIEAAYGTSRALTAGLCGDTDNGFALLFNYNILGAGQHTLEVLVDGETFATRDFRVVTLGGEFLQGLSGTVDVTDFPGPGDSVRLQWKQSSQDFGIAAADISDAPTGKKILSKIVGGAWVLDYDILTRWQDRFTFSGTVTRDNERKLWSVTGTNQFGSFALAAYDIETGLVAIYRPGSIIDDFFAFDFLGLDVVSGCQFTIDPPGSQNLSSCHLMTGTRGISFFSQGGNVGDVSPFSTRELEVRPSLNYEYDKLDQQVREHSQYLSTFSQRSAHVSSEQLELLERMQLRASEVHGQ